MNKKKYDILNFLIKEPYVNQRILSEQCGHSLGTVNKCIKELIEQGYLDERVQPTERALSEFQAKSPKRAIILAAGFGMRMVPINTETPKGLLEVNGEPLIERIIKQLREVGVNDIYIVVGFMKECYEYLIDDYNVKLIVNIDYASKNNLHSMRLVEKYLSDSYIVPCDIWCRNNPFHKTEPYSWYMVSDEVNNDSTVRVNRKKELVAISKEKGGNTMIGISYLAEKEACIVRNNIIRMSNNSYYDEEFWESALFEKGKMIPMARVVSSTDVIEINTYEQLRELDKNSNQLKSDAIIIAAKSLHANLGEIMDISVLKKGMTNRSFLFTCKDRKYIMRIPGEGTDKLINREEESNVYLQINKDNICDDIIYINPSNGYKITAYLEGARVCNAENVDDVSKSMRFLRSFHEKQLIVEHDFDIFRQIDFYESLWNGRPSVYRHYKRTKENVLSLKEYIDKHACNKVLTHIDAVPDNFLFVVNENGEEDIRLIDWEYAGMQDPHVDIAMFAIYAMYEKEQIDWLIDTYFIEGCTAEIRTKIYCYIAACGLLWSNWCEYKRNLGIEFGEYSLRQYRYAKDYYRYAIAEIEKMEGNKCTK